ncbi:MAG: endonuclease [Phascolarctobacterium sp.]|nr:DEAD/DEAH box helicase family protein [Phascolarctobacterium sp.]MUU07410.1 endonuclease [Phascolarctobacterium sp.]MUU17051.1 endonuclease [Phascolarctobacterium sp.]
MDNSLFYCGISVANEHKSFIDMLKVHSNQTSTQIYIINTPLGTENSYQYNYEDAVIVLIPKHKICIIDLKNNEKNPQFEDFCEDFIEDLGYLSDKYSYRKELGRPRAWKDLLITQTSISNIKNINDLLSVTDLPNDILKRNANYLISLLTGSINDISRIGGSHPNTILDEVKKKIILFDGDQSRFIYSDNPSKKRVLIQGLAGTGKTELLLHKLKDLYIKNKNSKIVFTCFNKILAQSMNKRIPEFFNFMKVEEQIKWNERLWVMHSWGSRGQANTGVYSYICTNYNINFHPYSYTWSFDRACSEAISELREQEYIEPCFDYMLIDESQDFPQNFLELCEIVTKNVVYTAGDIFQDIYDRTIIKSVSSDYLLNKCYRTDPKTLMFAHAVGMGLYEIPVIRWLEDEEWISCGYKVSRINNKIKLSRTPLIRFEDLDTSQIKSIELIGSNRDNFVDKIFEIIDDIRANHPTVQASDIAIVFLENENSNYQLADILSIEIATRYRWPAIKGYEAKNKSENALFISNRNNIKGLEFPFVISIANKKIDDDIFSRNTIYMMLTRSFITSYFLVNNKTNSDFIEKYSKAADHINKNGFMFLREPSKEEKDQQNQKISIAVTQKQRPIKDIIEEVFTEYPSLSSKNKANIRNSVMTMVEENNHMSEKEIQSRIRKLIIVLNGD